MWPFRGRDVSRSSDVWSGSWVVGQGEYDGNPLVVRKNVDAAALVGTAKFPLRFGVAVRLRAPDARGMPTEVELRELARIEDLLVDRLHAQQTAVVVLVITTGGMREFVFYTGSSAWAQKVVEDVQGEIVSHRLQTSWAIDPAWTVYEHFAL